RLQDHVEETAFILVKLLRRAGEPSAKPPGSQAHAADDKFCWRTTPQRGDKVLDDGSRARITSLDNLTVQLRRVAATFRPTGQDVVAVGVMLGSPSRHRGLAAAAAVAGARRPCGSHGL